MAFLQDLRLANIFPRNPAKDRPFGMPEIDEGNVGELFRQVGPLADTINRDRMYQQGQLANIAQNMRMAPRPSGLNLSGQGIAQAPGRHSVFDPNANVRLGGDMGPTPAQQMFLRQDAQEQNIQRQKEASDTAYGRAIDENKAQELHQERMQDKRINEQNSLFNRDFAAKKEMADIAFGHNKELMTGRNEFATKLEAQREAARRADIIAREKARGEQARLTQSEKPPTAASEKTDMSNRLQQIALSNPEAAKLIVKDEGSGLFRFADDISNEQMEWFRKQLAGGNKTVGKVMRQRNSQGQIRESTDGGKTWKMVSDGSAKK